MSSYSISSALKQTLAQTTLIAHANPPNGYDIIIKFHSAKNIPKFNILASMDPYFVARIDEQIIYTSSIILNTTSPVWNREEWIVRNIPFTAKLTIKVYNKHDDTIIDEYIGRVDIENLMNYIPPIFGHTIFGPFNRRNGSFHLSIQSMASNDETSQLPRYTFDGPCRFTRCDSFAVGLLTMLNTDCIYSTWKIQMRRISHFFPSTERQHWNRDHIGAQAIFGNHPLSLASQSTIRLAHKVLYGQTLKNSTQRPINNVQDLWKFIFTDPITHRIKPCVYTYIIDDNTWRFSETDVQFVADFVSKHALLANCSQHVRYAGEFHCRPKHGWDACDDEWELVFDNGSGTYSPNAILLDNLKNLLIFNFPGLNIITYDSQLKESVKLTRLHINKFS